jgi:uncharacterized protein (DUF2141 family)
VDWQVKTVAVCLTFAAVAASADTKATQAITISGRVLGASGKHPVHVALWDAGSFLERPVQEAQIAAGSEMHFQFTVRPSRWALSAFEDLNENGVLDMGLFGPKEPSGFWRPFSGWRKPRFDDVATVCDSNVSEADINLK